MPPAAGPRAWQASPGIFDAYGAAVAAAAASPPPSSAPAPHGHDAMVAGPSSALGGGSSSFLDALGSLAPVAGRATTCGPLMAAKVAPHMPLAGTRRPPAAGPAPMAAAAANFRHAHSYRPSAAPCCMPLVGNSAAASGQTVAPAIYSNNSYINTAPP
ncbi:hypothetical protein HXX76_007053 [Chlamydomonas incerta]|uniref:Uncharacterized protein n=1 Tax=Chlamydomonas incerta TaxID=51695 RepID=A0A835T4F8_CHLIN|nr:hypothetical protein HXX76_007053 [Chlamydomonas incerta]|eukprot:KAG2435858.1 hypothetical protein HXX76_007053 [Chlamydomonas incerta]